MNIQTIKKYVLKAIFTSLLVTITISPSFAQNDTIATVDRKVSTITLIGMNYEIGLSKKITLNTTLSLSPTFGYTYMQNNLNNKEISRFYYFFEPVMVWGFRWYYNLSKRKSEGKIYKRNSGNYVTISVGSSAPSVFGNVEKEYYSFSNNILWGMQRTYPNNLTWDVGIGLGYYFTSKEEQNFTPILKFSIGYVIN